MSAESLVPATTALLRHVPPEAPPHVDWLVELALPTPEHLRGEGPRVPTFRLPVRIDSAAAGVEIVAERIADHRRAYLDLAMPRDLSEGRGLVTPLRRGSVAGVRADRLTGGIHLEIEWREDRPTRQQLRLVPIDGARWSITVLGVD